MKIRQHIPAFCEGFEKAEAQVQTWMDIIKLPWVERVCYQPEFYRWSIERRYVGDDINLLMAEFKEGAEWWVIAFIEGTQEERDRLKIVPDWISRPRS